MLTYLIALMFPPLLFGLALALITINEREQL